ncbi:M3 family metallopeptidase [Dyella silvatica]|uniref:M3 family metallopeptidase n=1 Tax=Dyella silvatica TaxID=2992128 RepID=UPI0022500E4E|nr:M3 family metallopeptidase [Dyella silvatica]
MNKAMTYMGLAWVLGVCPLLGWATPPFTAAAAGAVAYHIDQTAYFASSAAEQAQRKTLLADITAFAAQPAPAAGALLGYLQRAETLLNACGRHIAYLHLRSALNIEGQASADAYDVMGSAKGRVITATRTSLRQLGDAGFANAIAAEPGLSRYAYVMQGAERGLPHELPAAQQTILDQLADPASSAFWTLYQQTRRSATFGKIRTADGEHEVEKDAKVLARDPDRTVRQTAWQRRWDGYTDRADIYAGLLLSIVRMNDRTARLQHFDDAPSAAYFWRQLNRHAIDDTLAAVADQADVMKTYQRMRAAHVTATTGIRDVRSWDLSLPATGFAPPRFTVEQVRAMSLAALAPLGKNYVTHFKALLDPAGGRMDVPTEQGKRVDDSFSISARGVPAGLFVGEYSGDLSGARVVIHEGGHAINAQLTNERGGSSFYEPGPSWISETIATVNEFLLYDYLRQHSEDPQAKAYYLQALLDEITFQIFTSAEEGDLEQSIYDGTVAGNIKNAADLDKLTLATMSKYDIWPAYQPQLAHTWMTKRLMYQDPLYLVNYMYSGLLATKMFDMAQRDPADFQQRYMQLLSSGADASPEERLRRFFGRDMSPREWVTDDMALLKQQTQALQTLYRQIEPVAPGATGAVATTASRGSPESHR